MARKASGTSRRRFFKQGFGVGAGALTLGRWPRGLMRRKQAGAPLIITSHTNETARNAMAQAWDILSQGGSALDAVERGANVIEVDPEDAGVGYGGLPNEDGVVQLDASCMDGKTYSAGCVASIEDIKTPSSVARLVMERTDHVMLVGPGAREFALSFGFKSENLLTENARMAWLRWRETHSESRDDWGPPDHLRGRPEKQTGDLPGEDAFNYGTTNVLAVDANGDVAGITTTSGLSWKIPGRIGASPVIGAGLYVDNDVGAAAATGRGEDVIKSCASYFIVGRMREGRSPQEACEDAIEMIVGRYRAVSLDFVPSEKFVAINRDGEIGCARMAGRAGAVGSLTYRNSEGIDIFEGTQLYPAS